MPKGEEKMANFVFTLSKNDVTAATRCFQFAKVAHQKGHDVFVYFFDDGVLWADKIRNWAEKTASGDCPDDHFPYLLEKEVAVGV
jgi:predicted peroxiredoxin